MHYRKDSLDLTALLSEEADYYHTLFTTKGIQVKFAVLLDKAVIFADVKR